MSDYTQDEYEKELQIWQNIRWLLSYTEDELGPPKCLIPLMAVVQENKQVVWSVLNYGKLNGFVDTFIANVEVCA